MDTENFGCIRVYMTSNEKDGYRSIFFRRPFLEEQYEHMDRIAIVLNSPPTFGENSIRSVFESFGDIEDVLIPGAVDQEDLQKLPLKHRKAVVTFSSAKSVDHAFNFNSSIIQPSIDAYMLDGVDTGIKRWKRMYNLAHPSHDDLQGVVDEFMGVFDEQQQIMESSLKDGKVVDEDGFTIVQSKKKRKVIPTKKFHDVKPTKGQGTLVNELFYGFHKKRDKQNQIADLKKQFQEDKRKASEIRKRLRLNQ